MTKASSGGRILARMDRTLILGTTNDGKLRELVELLAPHGIACRSLKGLAGSVDVEETGQSFAENAALKATLQARALGAWVLAEDSGLVVPALDGRPGIYSARFSGPGATDAANNALLLSQLAGRRGAARRPTTHAMPPSPTRRARSWRKPPAPAAA